MKLQRHPITASLRSVFTRADSVITALGVFLVVGIIVAIIATWFFSEIAETVIAGKTQGFDEAVLRYLGAYTHRVAISNSRLVALSEGSLTFRWRDSTHGNKKRHK